MATNVVASRPPNGDRLQRRPLVPKLFLIRVNTSTYNFYEKKQIEQAGAELGQAQIKLGLGFTPIWIYN